MSKTPFAQIQLPLSETNGTAAVEFYSKCQLVALAGHARVVGRRLLLGVERTCRSRGPTSGFDPMPTESWVRRR